MNSQEWQQMVENLAKFAGVSRAAAESALADLQPDLVARGLPCPIDPSTGRQFDADLW